MHRSSYLRQLENGAGRFPRDCIFRVVSDPEGARVGDGGSTMHVLNQLEQEFGCDRLSSMKIMVVHAGGYSKRLPSHSCSSKIFSAVPVLQDDDAPLTLLDLKLAMYLPFLGLMSAGDVFFTASDDLEAFLLEERDLEEAKRRLEEQRTKQGPLMLCSLAHPSTLAVGTGIGN